MGSNIDPYELEFGGSHIEFACASAHAPPHPPPEGGGKKGGQLTHFGPLPREGRQGGPNIGEANSRDIYII
jgi:hypothetical protein